MGGLCTGFADSSYAREGPRVHSSVPPAEREGPGAGCTVRPPSLAGLGKVQGRCWEVVVAEWDFAGWGRERSWGAS